MFHKSTKNWEGLLSSCPSIKTPLVATLSEVYEHYTVYACSDGCKMAPTVNLTPDDVNSY